MSIIPSVSISYHCSTTLLSTFNRQRFFITFFDMLTPQSFKTSVYFLKMAIFVPCLLILFLECFSGKKIPKLVVHDLLCLKKKNDYFIVYCFHYPFVWQIDNMLVKYMNFQVFFRCLVRTFYPKIGHSIDILFKYKHAFHV